MLTSMLEKFSAYYKKNGDKVILEQYNMKQGLYLLVNNQGIKDYLYIPERSKELNISEDKKVLYNYFKERDYLSILLLYSTNKSISKKTIHSNNYLSLFTKKKSLFDKGKLSKKILCDINEYFGTFAKWEEIEEQIKKQNIIDDPKKEILKEAPNFNHELYSESKNALIESLEPILALKEFQILKDDDYIRIFYEVDKKEYENEYKRYMVRKVFNKDKYHIKKHGKIYGLSNVDMGTNSNKPSLELKSMKTLVPFKVDFDTALMLQKLYDFLFFYNIRKVNPKTKEVEYVSSIYKTLYIPYDFNIDGLDLNIYTDRNQATHYIKTGNGISFNIVDYDLIPQFNTKIDFNFKNYLGNSEDLEDINEEPLDLIIKNLKTVEKTLKNQLTYEPINFITQLEKAVDYYFFNYNLVRNYSGDDVKIINKEDIPGNLKNLIYISRNLFYEWFRKGNDIGIVDQINKITKKILMQWISIVETNKDLYRVRNVLNLRLSIIEYLFKREGDFINMEENFSKIRANITNKLKTPKPEKNFLETTEEFYYLAGQLTFYILSKNKVKLKKMQDVTQFIECENNRELKRKITTVYAKNCKDILLYDFRFNTAYNLITTYSENSKMKDYIDYFMSGFSSGNLIYRNIKKDEREGVLNEK